MSNILKRIMEGIEPGTGQASQDFVHEIKVMRENLSEEHIEDMLKNSSATSDATAWY